MDETATFRMNDMVYYSYPGHIRAGGDAAEAAAAAEADVERQNLDAELLALLVPLTPDPASKDPSRFLKLREHVFMGLSDRALNFASGKRITPAQARDSRKGSARWDLPMCNVVAARIEKLFQRPMQDASVKGVSDRPCGRNQGPKYNKYFKDLALKAEQGAARDQATAQQADAQAREHNAAAAPADPSAGPSAAPASARRKPPPWTCRVCTLVNQRLYARRCEACGTERSSSRGGAYDAGDTLYFLGPSRTLDGGDAEPPAPPSPEVSGLDEVFAGVAPALKENARAWMAAQLLTSLAIVKEVGCEDDFIGALHIPESAAHVGRYIRGRLARL